MHIAYGAAASGFSGYWFIIYPILFLAMWYVLIRPQSQQQKKHRELVEGLKKGDRVITSGGLHGVVVDTKEDTIVLRIAPKMDVTVQRSAVQSVTGHLSKDDQRRQGRAKAPSEIMVEDTADETKKDGMSE